MPPGLTHFNSNSQFSTASAQLIIPTSSALFSADSSALATSEDVDCGMLMEGYNQRVRLLFRSCDSGVVKIDIREPQSNVKTALRVSPLLVESVQEVGFVIVALKTLSGTISSK